MKRVEKKEGCLGISPVMVWEMEGVQAGGVCEGGPRGFRRRVRGVRKCVWPGDV